MIASTVRARDIVMALCVAVLTTLVVARAQAQDPRETVVQATTREWLALTDNLDGDASWKAAGEKFKKQMPAAEWTQALRTYREPLGKVLQRASVSTSFRTDIPGAPDGNYALLQFRTAFEKKSEGHESVTLELEPDGRWRVIGYFIR